MNIKAPFIFLYKLNHMDHQTPNRLAEIRGYLSVQMTNGLTIDDFCQEHIPEYNRDRFEALAIRILVGNETVVTVYAVDKFRQENSGADPDKVPVKKFKLMHLGLKDVLNYCTAFNCTLTNGNHNIEDMEVINK